MSSQIRIVKEKLNLAITQLCETSWMFVKNPTRDFTRERKLPLREVISILLCMEGGSLTGELLRYFRCSRYSPSGSAFIQQRQKINEFAFPSLFSLSVKHTDMAVNIRVSVFQLRTGSLFANAIAFWHAMLSFKPAEYAAFP